MNNQHLNELLLSNLPIIVFHLNPQGDFLLSRGAALAYLGLADGQLVGQNALTVYQEYPDVLEQLHRALRGDSFSSRVCAMGRSFLVHYCYQADRTVIGIASDITEHSSLEQEQEAQQQRLIQAYAITREGMWEWHIQTGKVSHNARLKEIFSIPAIAQADQLNDFKQRFHPEDAHHAWQTVIKALHSGALYEQTYRIVLNDGSIRYIHDRGKVVERDIHQKPVRMIGSVSDVTDQVLVQQQLLNLSQYDPLTGLANRAFARQVFETMKREADQNHHAMAMMFLDLDDFKLVNDTLGHEAGDELLLSLTGMLKQLLPAHTLLSRHGGDEFLLLIHEYHSLSELDQLANRFLSHIAQPFTIHDMTVKVGVSIGVSLYPQDGSDFNTLLRHADSAMYEAKRLGRNQYRFFMQQLDEKAQRKLFLLNHLHQALENDQFSLVYQPQMNMNTQMWEGAEALMRWRLADGTPVSPAEFIPLAEESGLILSMTHWLIHRSVATLSRWRKQGVCLNNLAINVPIVALEQPDFYQRLCGLMDAYQLDASLLELELTESQLLSEQNAAVMTSVQLLATKGFKLAIDDFGTGYSNLSQLRKMRVGKLKIDKSFVDLIGNREDSALTLAMLSVAHSLNINVLAEGVETDAQTGWLMNHGCHVMQGYYFAKPLLEEDFIRGYWQFRPNDAPPCN